jgi:YggT family protein
LLIIQNFVHAIGTVLDFILTIYMYIIIARAVLSWVNPDPYNPIVSFLYQATEPVLYRVRQYIPLPAMGIDFSPIIVFAIIIFLKEFLVATLKGF